MSEPAGRGAPSSAKAQHRPTGLLVVLAITLLGIGAIVFGRVCADPDVRVFYFQADPIEDFEVGAPRSYPQINVWVIALADDGVSKQLRALDGRAPTTDCTIQLQPEDERGAEGNPTRRPGVFIDPCSRDGWYLSGDALPGTSTPLRVFTITRPPPEDAEGRPIVEIEVLGREDPRATPTEGG